MKIEKNTSDFFEKKSHSEQLDILVKRMIKGIPGEEDNHARKAVEELYLAIIEINKLQQDFENGENQYRMDFLTKQLNLIAKEYHIKVNDLKGELLKALMISQCPNPEDFNNWKREIHKGPIQKRKINAVTNSLLEIMDCSIQNACCSEISNEDKDAGRNDDLLTEIEPELASRAMEIPLWSEAETALKWQLAVNAIIMMQKDDEVKASPIACALQIAVTSVTHLKYIYLMTIADRILKRKLSRYLRSVLPSCIVTTIRKSLDEPAVWQKVLEISGSIIINLGARKVQSNPILISCLTIILQSLNIMICKSLFKWLPGKMRNSIIKQINNERIHEKLKTAIELAERKLIPLDGNITIKSPTLQYDTYEQLIQKIQQSNHYKQLIKNKI